MTLVTAAQGNRSQLIAKKQTGIGVIATGNFNKLRYNTHSLNVKKDGIESNEMRSDREIQDYRHGNRHALGDILVEPVHGDHDMLFESAMFNSFTAGSGGASMTLGTVPQYLTIEDGALDIGQYMLYQDMLCSRMSIQVRPGTESIVKTTFNFIGTDGSNPVTTSSGGIPIVPSNKSPFASFAGGVYDTANLSGGEIASITSLDLTLDNGVDAKMALGQQTAVAMEYKRARVSGSFTALLTDNALINRFRNEIETALVLRLIDPSQNEMQFVMGRIKYSGSDVPVANEQSRLITVPFMALRDSNIGSALKITKIPQ
jgi:hypothetical protein